VDETFLALCALAMVVGVIGVVVPVLPGLILCWATAVIWAAVTDGPGWVRWLVVGLATVWVIVGTAVKYAWPGRRMKTAGVPTSTLFAGVALGLIGFFVIPVVGLPLGFVGGVWLAEARRTGGFDKAWPSTKAALLGTGLSMLVELGAALLVAATWAVGVALV